MGLRVVFMGTPDFAVPSLEHIIKSKHQVVGVVTAPDKPSGRGLKITESPVKLVALNASIPVAQPEKLKDESFIQVLDSWNADVYVVVAFRMLPEIVWSKPPKGTFNLHASLLPKYRGAAPINWALINGDTETGCTTFFLQQEIDTGEIILQEKTTIEPNDTFESLYNKLKYQGSELVVRTLDMIDSDTIKKQAQLGEITHAPKIYKELGALDFNKSCKDLHSLVKGLYPTPGCYFNLDGKNYKVYVTEYEELQTNQIPSTLVTDNKSYLSIVCSDGYLKIKEIQAEGKKRLPIKEFLAGNKL